jgi:dethiobiotin synthetase
MQPIFITGIGTDVGKTVIAAIITQALQADYWKPVQAGFAEGTDSEWVKHIINNKVSKIYKETYKLTLAASPHIAAREEGIKIDLNEISSELKIIQETTVNNYLIIEGAGGLMVPINEKEFVIDLIKKLNAKVILVSRNYLGSINHSLLTAKICHQYQLDVIGWIFNDQYLEYEDEIVHWSSFPKIASVSFSQNINKGFINEQANAIRPLLLKLL